MMKKVLVLFLTFMLALGSWTVSASENDEYATRLKTIDVFKGTGSNDFQLDREPTRLEGLVMFIRLLGAEQEALSGR
jgi:ABC-type oligopeptide transport system substrate-binding subunit